VQATRSDLAKDVIEFGSTHWCQQVLLCQVNRATMPTDIQRDRYATRFAGHVKQTGGSNRE